MVCPRCGSEHNVDVLKVYRSRSADGKFTQKLDCRDVKCTECDLVWCEVSEIAHISVYDPTKNEKKKVTRSEYEEVWRIRDEIHPKKLKLFDV